MQLCAAFARVAECSAESLCSTSRWVLYLLKCKQIQPSNVLGLVIFENFIHVAIVRQVVWKVLQGAALPMSLVHHLPKMCECS